MPRTRHKYFCPSCRNEYVIRLRRRLWMRLIPGTRHYLCRKCASHFLTVGGWPIPLSPQEQCPARAPVQRPRCGEGGEGPLLL
jgi:hypothetical protein